LGCEVIDPSVSEGCGIGDDQPADGNIFDRIGDFETYLAPEVFQEQGIGKPVILAEFIPFLF